MAKENSFEAVARDGFISYSRQDFALVDELYNRLTKYRTPSVLRRRKGVFGKPPRKLSIFLDRKSIEVGGQLSTRLRDNLKSSKWLIVVCSKDSKDSFWVNQEIEIFVSAGKSDFIIPLFIRESKDEALEDVIPHALKKLGTKIPLGADLLLDGGIVAVRDKIIGAFLGFSQDEIAREQERDDLKKRRFGQFITTVIGCLAIVAFLQWRVSESNRAISNHHLGLALLNESQMLLQEGKPTKSYYTSALALGKLTIPNQSSKESLLFKDSDESIKASTIVSLTGHEQVLPISLIDTNNESRTIGAGSTQGFIAFEGGKNEIHVASLKDNLSKMILKGHDDYIYTIRFHPNMNVIASFARDGKLIVWNLDSRMGYALCDQKAAGRNIDFSSNGKYLASIDNNGRVYIWDWQNNRLIKEIDSSISQINDIKFSKDGKFILYANKEGVVKIRRTTDWAPATTFQLSSLDPLSISIHPNSRIFAVGTLDGRIEIFDIYQQKKIHTYQAHPENLWRVQFVDNGQYLLTAGWEGALKIWETGNYHLDGVLDAHDSWVTDVNKIDEETFITSSFDGFIRFWKKPNKPRALRTLNDHDVEVINATYDQSGQMMATVGLDTQVNLYQKDEYDSWNLTCPKFSHNNWLAAASFGQRGNLLASTGYTRADGKRVIPIWSTKTCTLVQEIEVSVSGKITDVALTSGGSHVIISSGDGLLSKHDIALGEIVWSKKVKSDMINFIDLSPDQIHMATANSSGKAAIRRVADGEVVASWQKEGEQNWRVKFNPDGEILAIGGSYKSVILWRWKVEKSPAITLKLNDSLSGMAFSEDSKYLAAGTVKKTLYIWNLLLNELDAVLDGVSGIRGPFAFEPGTQRLAFDGGDGKVMFWDLGINNTRTEFPLEFNLKGAKLTLLRHANSLVPSMREAESIEVVTARQCME